MRNECGVANDAERFNWKKETLKGTRKQIKYFANCEHNVTVTDV